MSGSPNQIMTVTDYMAKLEQIMKNNTIHDVDSELRKTNIFLVILGHFGIFIGGLVLLVLFTVFKEG